MSNSIKPLPPVRRRLPHFHHQGFSESLQLGLTGFFELLGLDKSPGPFGEWARASRGLPFAVPSRNVVEALKSMLSGIDKERGDSLASSSMDVIGDWKIAGGADGVERLTAPYLCVTELIDHPSYSIVGAMTQLVTTGWVWEEGCPRLSNVVIVAFYKRVVAPGRGSEAELKDPLPSGGDKSEADSGDMWWKSRERPTLISETAPYHLILKGEKSNQSLDEFVREEGKNTPTCIAIPSRDRSPLAPLGEEDDWIVCIEEDDWVVSVAIPHRNQPPLSPVEKEEWTVL